MKSGHLFNNQRINKMDTLFEMPESKSPRLKWLERKNVITECQNWPDDPWEVRVKDDPANFGRGDTEHDAIVDLAKRNGWKIWNEE